jgi:protocatechuate 3,4-dioxygenase, alpha subunit
MVQKLDYIKESPSQTAGPYVHIGLASAAAGFEIFDNVLGREIAGPNTPGERITVEGHVLDGVGAPVKDILIETWQADSQGRYPDGSGDFRGWGRIIPNLDTGVFSFQTIKPGPVGPQAPHITFWLVARGINIGLHTRMYFPDDDHSGDPLMRAIEHAGRRPTLVAAAEGNGRYRFDIRLQGEGETVFLDI